MAIKVNLATLKAALAAGPMDMASLAKAIGRSSPWDLEKDLKEMEAGWRMMVENGVDWSSRFTVFPARERARYGFPDIVPVIKGENPNVKKRARKVPAANDAKEQKQYWPLVAWADIEPLPAGTNEGSAYDGRHDDEIETLRDILSEAGFDCLEVKGRMVRGGSGIYISLVRDADSKDAESEPEPPVSCF